MAKAKGSEATQLSTEVVANELPTGIVKAAPMELAQNDFLGGAEFESDGFEENTSKEFRMARISWNKGGLENGVELKKNEFVNSVTKERRSKLRLAMLTYHRSNEFSKFNAATNRTDVHCRSWDQKIGTMADGRTRPCEGCPHKEWRETNGKRGQDCSEVYATIGVDRENGDLLSINFKRTAINPLITHMNAHFIGKRVVGGRRMNYPFFSRETTMSLKMETNGSTVYAVPVFEMTGVLDHDETKFHEQTAIDLRRTYFDRVREVAEAPDDAPAGNVIDGQVVDTSFEFGANAEADYGGDGRMR